MEIQVKQLKVFAYWIYLPKLEMEPLKLVKKLIMKLFNLKT